MERSKEDLYQEFAAALDRVPPAAARWYRIHSPLLATRVNAALQADPKLKHYLGPNSIQVMFDNHHHHTAFVHTCLLLKSAQCLVEVVHWVYRSYIARGFDRDYFQVELRAWKQAIERNSNYPDFG